MLCLNLTPGEYMTIGGNVVVQLDCISGDRCKLMVEAPREISILRGEVLERTGGQRPSCVFDAPRWHKREISWNRSKAQALAAMRKLLSQMDGRDSNVQSLRRQLNHMFPMADAASCGPEGRPEQEPVTAALEGKDKAGERAQFSPEAGAEFRGLCGSTVSSG